MFKNMFKNLNYYCILLFLIVKEISSQEEDENLTTGNKFTPTVTAVCRGNNEMVISVNTLQPFYGLVVSRNLRNSSSCYVEGKGQTLTTLTLNMAASIHDPDYCAVSVNHKTSEKTVQIGVRQHKTLELAEDKLYVVSCGKYNSPPPSSGYLPARLYFTDASGREVKEVVKSHAYKLRVKTNQKDFRVRNCFAFTNSDNQVPLFDHMGCPESRVMSRWNYFNDNSEAESTIYSMFRFQESRELNFQCHVLFCSKETCPKSECSEIAADSSAFYTQIPQRLISGNNDTDVFASVSVNVLEPGDKLEPYTLESDILSECPSGSRFCPVWLLWLAIILGVLFILMLLVNLFLCTALTCTCTRTELVEKDPSIMEDYDPYRTSWAGSQYGNGSRYAIGGGQDNNNLKKYSTESNMSDHYATVPGLLPSGNSSRPGSRFEKF